MYKAILDNVHIVALKVLNLDQSAPSHSQLQTFKDEIKIMRACRFQNVVSFMGSWVQKMC